MRRRDTRVKIAPGIYRDACWWYGTVHVRGAGELNPKTGKRRNLGTFATREEALKHERAVQFFKRRG